MLHALIENNPHNITKDYKLKHFLHGCKHSTFLETEMRREQHIVALKHKFEPQNIVNTLSGYLQLSNSPAQNDRLDDTSLSYRNHRRQDYPRTNTRDTCTSNPKYNFKTRFRSNKSYSKRSSDTPYQDAKEIQKVQFAADDENEYNSDDSYDHDNYNAHINYAYNVSINAIKANPLTVDMSCLVCEIVHGKPPSDGHRFEDCTILNNHSILKKQFISFCSTIRRSRRALKNHEIKRMQLTDTTDETDSDDKDDNSTATDSKEDDQDFPPGQY